MRNDAEVGPSWYPVNQACSSKEVFQVQQQAEAGLVAVPTALGLGITVGGVRAFGEDAQKADGLEVVAEGADDAGSRSMRLLGGRRRMIRSGRSVEGNTGAFMRA